MKKSLLYAIIFVIVAFIFAKLGQVIFVLWNKKTMGIIIYITGWIILLTAMVIFGKEIINSLRKQSINKLIKKLKKK